MYLRIASDLHLEAYHGRNIETLVIDTLPDMPYDSSSILILAGDISSSIIQLVSFIKVLEQKYKKIIYVPGNHEYYKHDYHEWNTQVDKLFSENLSNTIYSLGEVKTFVIDDTKFIFGTLWSDGGKTLEEKLKVESALNDFRLIKYDNRTFSVHDMIKIHKAQKRKIVSELKKHRSGKTIVITHHMPSYELCHPRFGNTINGGFASNCSKLLKSEYAPDFWIYGHTHDTGDIILESTRCIANPKGYPNEFKYTKTIQYNTFEIYPKIINI